MIVVERDTDLQIITQTDHAYLAAQILSLWRTELAGHPRRREILYAARHHDNGWQEADAAPTLDPSGTRPYDFLSIPQSVYVSIWERGTTRYLTQDSYVALLITEHALRVRTAAPRDRGEMQLLETLSERRDDLQQSTQTDDDQLAEDYRWVALADFLSLVACCGWSVPFRRHGVSGILAGDTLRLTPFPLAGATTLGVPCRHLPRRAFTGDADLATALASCRWQRATMRVAPDQTVV